MDEQKERASLSRIGEPDRIEVLPGLILEDKLRIKTQRRLEKQFGLPISRIFPGQDKKTKDKWPGVDFEYLDNTIPLLTILAQQVNDEITEQDIETILDAVEDESLMAANLEKYFRRMKPKGKAKNSRRPNRKKK